MCGFFYTNDRRDSHKLLYKKIVKDLSTRGPDSNNIKFKNKNIFLATRLSIFDRRSRSNQPFTDEKKRYFLLFNGAIYNYLELKTKLSAEGINFNTDSDTEVLFKSLIHNGINKTLKDI